MTLLPWAVAVPLIVAALLLAASSFVRPVLANAVALVTVAATAVLCAFIVADAAHGPLVYWFGGWHPGNHVQLGIAFGVDLVSASFALVASLLTAAVIVAGIGTFDRVGAPWNVLILAHLGAAIGFIYTADLFNFFVFYELTTVAEFALAGYKVASAQGTRNAYSFGMAASSGCIVLLFGLALLEGRTGDLNAVAIGESLSRAPHAGLTAVAFALVTAGLLVKAAMPPFHFWFVDAQETAPSPTGVLFSGLLALLAVYGVERTWTLTFAHAHLSAAGVASIVTAYGCVAALVASVLSFGTTNLKRALAFVSVSQMGLFLAGAVAAGPGNVTGSITAALATGLALASLALWIGDLHPLVGSVDERKLAGALRGHREMVPAVVCALLALAGIPPAATAFGRAALHGPVFVVAILVAALATGRFARAALVSFLSRDAAAPHAIRWTPDRAARAVPPLILAVAALVSGLIPWSAFARAGAMFASTEFIAQAVLHAPIPAPAGPPAPVLGRVALLVIVTLAIAIVVALAAPIAQRTRVVRALAQLHEGSIADYMTWFAGGVAAITTAVLLAGR